MQKNCNFGENHRFEKLNDKEIFCSKCGEIIGAPVSTVERTTCCGCSCGCIHWCNCCCNYKWTWTVPYYPTYPTYTPYSPNICGSSTSGNITINSNSI